MRVRHLFNVIVDDIGIERIASMVKRPLVVEIKNSEGKIVDKVSR